MEKIGALGRDFMADDKLTPEELKSENQHKCWTRR